VITAQGEWIKKDRESNDAQGAIRKIAVRMQKRCGERRHHINGGKDEAQRRILY
jgi:hypothetical protein